MERSTISKHQFMQECLLLYPHFVVDDHNRKVMQAVYDYLTENPAFNRKGLHLGKGLLLSGSVGSGKTVLIMALNRALTRCGSEARFKIVTPWSIADEFSRVGYEALQKYKTSNWCFDELGMADRETGKNYGNTVNVAEALILERYQRFKQGQVTHFTTNLPLVSAPGGTDASLSTIYDDRTVSRLKEMCNIIQLTGVDRRENAVPAPPPPPVYAPPAPPTAGSTFEAFAAARPDLVTDAENRFMQMVKPATPAPAAAPDYEAGLAILQQQQEAILTASEADFTAYYQDAYRARRKYPNNWALAKALKQERQKGAAA